MNLFGLQMQFLKQKLSSSTNLLTVVSFVEQKPRNQLTALGLSAVLQFQRHIQNVSERAHPPDLNFRRCTSLMSVH